LPDSAARCQIITLIKGNQSPSRVTGEKFRNRPNFRIISTVSSEREREREYV